MRLGKLIELGRGRKFEGKVGPAPGDGVSWPDAVASEVDEPVGG